MRHSSLESKLGAPQFDSTRKSKSTLNAFVGYLGSYNSIVPTMREEVRLDGRTDMQTILSEITKLTHM